MGSPVVTSRGYTVGVELGPENTVLIHIDDVLQTRSNYAFIDEDAARDLARHINYIADKLGSNATK